MSPEDGGTVITYVLEYPGIHLIKIGQAKYYQDRISQLRNGVPIEPKPVCAFLGANNEGAGAQAVRASPSLRRVLSLYARSS